MYADVAAVVLGVLGYRRLFFVTQETALQLSSATGLLHASTFHDNVCSSSSTCRYYTQRLQVEHRCSIVTTSTQSLTSWMIRWKYAMSCRSARCFSLKHGMTAIYSVSSVSVWTGSRSSIARDHGPAPPLWLQNMAASLRRQSLEFVCVTSTSASKQPRSSCIAPIFSGSSDCDVTVLYCTGSIL